jgi:hypothetical protein
MQNVGHVYRFNVAEHTTWTSLTRCIDPPRLPTLDCGQEVAKGSFWLGGERAHPKVWQRAQHLCHGLRRIQHATCADLSRHSFVQEAIGKIGLTWDGRKADLYGTSGLQHMLPRPFMGHTGLWQDPSQLAAALLSLGASVREIRTYAEVGCFTAWTSAVVATYLQRVGHRLRGLTIDVRNETVLTHQILHSLNVTFELRSNVTAPQAARRLHPHRVRRPPPIDLCFIDAGHSYAGLFVCGWPQPRARAFTN